MPKGPDDFKKKKMFRKKVASFGIQFPDFFSSIRTAKPD